MITVSVNGRKMAMMSCECEKLCMDDTFVQQKEPDSMLSSGVVQVQSGCTAVVISPCSVKVMVFYIKNYLLTERRLFVTSLALS